MPARSSSPAAASPLPVAECFEPLAAALAAAVPVVLKAPPGAGKSTGVPPELLRRGVAGQGQMLLVQPRRLAARSVAARLAEQMQTPLGDRVGYHVRFDKRVSANTQLVVLTTGMLLRRLAVDPLLDNVSCVILDEFHERSLEVDLALGMLQRIRVGLRPELRLVVMSATLDPAAIVAALGDAVPLTSEGRSFPVTLQYVAGDSRARLSERVADLVPRALEATSGDLLVFLPGIGEIRATRRAIQAAGIASDVAIHELYGNLSLRDQNAVLAPSATRKLVLATNVAETSVTIPGVTGVIDSGLARVPRFDPRVGLPQLQLEPISQAAADQRTGRAGRTQPGHCWRLWSETVQRSRRAADTPEIERADFSTALLTLASWGESDAQDFPWLTPPRREAVAAAGQLLRRLGALDEQGRITPTGQQMADLPLHPRLARLVLTASALGERERAALAAALLSERDPLTGDAAAAGADEATSACDLLDRIARLQRFGNGQGFSNGQGFRSGQGSRSGLGPARGSGEAVRQLFRVADQIANLVQPPRDSATHERPDRETSDRDRADRASGDANRRPQGGSDAAFKRALLAAYPDRLARRRGPGEDRGVMVGGRGVRLHPSSRCRDGEFFLCLDVDSAGTEATVRLASSIDPQWLEPLTRVVDEPIFQPSTQAVIARRRHYVDDLLLSEAPIECPRGGAVAELLFQHARGDLSQALPDGDHEAGRFIQRVRFLSTLVDPQQLPPLDDAALLDVLPTLCETRLSFAELRSAPWLEHLRGRYDYPTLRWIDQQAPARIEVPSGNSVAVHYAAGKTPWIAVRIQELFGWRETPRIAQGRVPLQLHLLGPNQRPQQITDDLANFWRETYAQVRKDLRGRYPKHHWPEDPLAAVVTSLKRPK